MSPLTTLAGVENGTDVAVQSTGTERVERWTVSEGGLVKDGVFLGPELFSGYLSAGRVHLADFSPPTVGEWFAQRDDGVWHYLVVEVEGSKAQTMQFRHRAYFQFQERRDLVDRFTRIQAPEWATPLVVNLGRALWDKHKQVERMNALSRQVYNLQEDLRYITVYAERATNTLREMET